MDLRLHTAEPTAEEREAIDALLGAPSSRWEGGDRTDAREAHVSAGGHESRGRRHLLLPALHALQSRVGWVSEGGLNYVCQRLTVPPADAWGVATFYAFVSTEPQPSRMLHVCDDVVCRNRGARDVIDALERVSPPSGSHTNGASAAASCGWMRSPCLGLCDHAPAALYCAAGVEPNERLMGNVFPTDATALLAATAPTSAPETRQPLPQQGSDALRLLARVGMVDPTDLDAYRASGGYAALRRAFELGPEGIIRELNDARLVGRGGAAFPTGRKWDAVARQPVRPHYLICNADESEPGTFKDRVLMEGDPFAVVEAMTIAALATGCHHGYVYLRAEYPLAHERLAGAIAQARARQLLGGNIMGRGLAFDIEIRKGAGAYICGEETALLNSIEGFRGEPRNKPPFPVNQGLFGKPTLVNNVETLVNVLPIVLHGGEAYAATGTAQSTGTRLFCVSGAVQRPGVYEVPFGTRLRNVLELSGGLPPGRSLQAILLGGAAGVFVHPGELDIVLSLEGARDARATLGSGVVVAFDDTMDLPDAVRRIASFFRDESCGQCVPCRVGTVRQEEALARLSRRSMAASDVDAELALLSDVGRAMRDASICGLGQTASSAVESAIHRLGLYHRNAPV